MPRPNNSAPSISSGEVSPVAVIPQSESNDAPLGIQAADRNSDVTIGVAVPGTHSGGGTVTARRAGGLRDLAMVVDPHKVGIGEALQHLAKAINIAFQTDFSENYLESVYQAAIVRHGEVHVIHKEYFGFGDTWFGEFGKLIRSLQLTLEGPDPVSPEGRERILEKGPSTIRGILSAIGRKLDLVAEYEDRVPAYLEQTLDRLEGSGIILGWNRDDWEIRTTRIGLDIRIAPREGLLDELNASLGKTESPAE